MENKYYVCENCNKKFTQKYNLNKHINGKRCKGIEYSKFDKLINMFKVQENYNKKKIE
jgi:transcription initiation factor IIE alpha subunit